MKKNKEEVRFLPLSYDNVFKGFFVKESNKKFLLDLLNHYLDLNIKSEDDITILNCELTPNKFVDKQARLDLRIRINNKEWIDIEVQQGYRDYFLKRTLYYNSKMYADQIEKGEDYNKLEQVYSLVFLYYNQFKDSNGYKHTIADYILEDNKMLPNGRIIKFIEVAKYKKHKNDFKEDSWTELLGVKTEEEFESIIERGGLMAEAAEKIKGFTQRDIDNYWKDMVHKAQWDEAEMQDRIKRKFKKQLDKLGQEITEKNQKITEKDRKIIELETEKNEKIHKLETEKAKEIAKLRTEKNKEIVEKTAKAEVIGIEEGKLLVAKNMFLKGLDINDIALFTNLTIEELQKFKEENGL